jgi:hypothetical protein
VLFGLLVIELERGRVLERGKSATNVRFVWRDRDPDSPPYVSFRLKKLRFKVCSNRNGRGIISSSS